MIHPFPTASGDDTKQLVSDFYEGNAPRSFRVTYVKNALELPREKVLAACQELVKEGKLEYGRMGWYTWKG